LSSLNCRRRLTRTVTCGAAALGGLIAAGPAAATPGRTAVPGTHPAWATTRAAATPSVAATGAVNLRVYLASADPSGLAAYAKAVSDPKNAAYGDYLTPGQAQAKFGPTAAEANAVEAWLSGTGLTVTGSTSGFGAYVGASGTVAQASQAFGVQFAEYAAPGGGTARAPESSATVPTSIASDVAAVSGLDNAKSQIRPGDTLPGPPASYFVAPPTSTYYGSNVATSEPKVDGRIQPWTVAGYTPQQIRGAYNVTQSGTTGRGVTVAVVDAYAAPTILQDADQFSKVTGNQPFRAGQFNQYLPSSYDDTSPDECDAQGWYGEETLDVEAVHDMAPDANVDYVGGSDCTDPGLLAADALIVKKHLASIVTDSWGETTDSESIGSEYDQVFEAGAAEGIGFFFSSGDSGYEDPTYEDGGSDKIQADYPDSSPWVTAVGGTSLAIGPRNNYEWELPWGTVLDPLAAGALTYTPPPSASDVENYYDGSSGGGVSTVYREPWYQRWVVPNSLATDVPEGSTTTPMRVVPDVSALADPSTGMLVGETTLNPSGSGSAFYLSRIGGTSVASPTFAGIEADAQQAAGYDLGFANPAIYLRHGSPAFHDVTEYTPQGPATQQFEYRNNYTDPATAAGPINTYLRIMGLDGTGASALTATPGYDDATGVGSPNDYIESFFRGGWGGY
jgi:subtilase family serine protease